jgi:thiol-disulfide isomerase/thioredoxin
LKELRTINLLILIAFILSLSVGVYAQEEENPDFSLMEYYSGQRHSFADILTTKVNIMVVTSTTCGSCISELRAMDWIRAKYKGDMSVTAVFVDRAGEARVYRYLKYYNFDLDKILVDPGGAVPNGFDAHVIPTMIMFDKKGNEYYRTEGFKSGDESMIIYKAEEIIYNKRRAPRQTPRSQTTEAAQPAPKTTGCASTG